MEKEATSFWVDIKRYEDILASEPNSFCFAQLSDLYRKMNLLDDALTVARRGIAVHPDYAGGYLALGRACYDKGLKKESREALERVVRVNPENMPAQRILSHLYLEAGDSARATSTLKSILYLDPNDAESRIMLESLERVAAVGFGEMASERHALPEAEVLPDEDDSIELLELSEAELVLEEDGEEATPFEFDIEPSTLEEGEPLPEIRLVPVVDTRGADDLVSLFEPDAEAAEETFADSRPAPVYELPVESDAAPILRQQPPERDPLATSTLAELYISQGFLKRALKVYRDLLEEQPDNVSLRERILELKARIDEDEEEGRRAVMLADDHPDEEHGLEEVAAAVSEVGEPMGQRDYDPVAVLEGWLDNLRRLR